MAKEPLLSMRGKGTLLNFDEHHRIMQLSSMTEAHSNTAAAQMREGLAAYDEVRSNMQCLRFGTLNVVPLCMNLLTSVLSSISCIITGTKFPLIVFAYFLLLLF